MISFTRGFALLALSFFAQSILCAQNDYSHPYFITTLAGLSPGNGKTIDGMGEAARFSAIAGIAVDSAGNGYVSDVNSIRKFTGDGSVVTLAGISDQAGLANGTGDQARFYGPEALACDASGNIYVADTQNNAIRIVTPAGVVTLLAGGTEGSLDGVGSAAQFRRPAGVAVTPGGVVYVSDSDNHTIRKITADGTVSTIAGSALVAGFADGNGAVARFNYPKGLALDSGGYLYVADANNNAVRKVSSLGVVTTVSGFFLDPSPRMWDGTIDVARFNSPRALASDNSGNIYVADYGNGRIRLIAPSQGTVMTLAGAVLTDGFTDGTGSAAHFAGPRGIAITSEGIYISDGATIRQGVPAQQGLPVFGLQPSSQNIAAGTAVTLKVAVNAVPQVTVQWEQSTDHGATWATASNDWTVYPGTSYSILKFYSVPLEFNGRQFRCAATNSAGTTYSSVATLTLSLTAPTFQAQPADQTIPTNTNVRFHVVASGSPTPTWQWQESRDSGATWVNTVDPTSSPGDATYYVGSNFPDLDIVKASVAMSGYQYRCVATNAAGSLISSTATLTVRPPPANDNFANAILIEGSNAQVTGNSFGATMEPDEPNPTNSLWWKWKSTTPGLMSMNITNEMPGLSFAIYTGNSLSTLTRLTTSQEHFSDHWALMFVATKDTTYWIQIGGGSSPGASDDSISLNLALSPLPDFSPSPSAQTVIAGQTAQFSVSASILPSPSFRWQISTDLGATWTDFEPHGGNSGAGTRTLTLTTSASASGVFQYRCIATSLAGQLTSNVASLTIIKPPQFTLLPSLQRATVGFAANFSAAVTGFPAPSLQWQLSTDSGVTWSNLSDGSPYDATKTAKLIISPVTTAMSGYRYRCVATNDTGSATSTAASLIVYPLPSNDGFANATLLTGTELTAYGSNDGATKQSGEPDHGDQAGGHSVWWKWVAPSDGIVAIYTSGSTLSTMLAVYTGTTVDHLTLLASGKSYAFNPPSPSDTSVGSLNVTKGTTYWIAVDGAQGTTGVIPLVINLYSQVAAGFTTQPLSQTVRAGSSITFSVVASGVPAPSLQWQLSQDEGVTWTNLPEPAYPYINTGSNPLQISGITQELSGNRYRCVFTNIANVASSDSATLTVLPALVNYGFTTVAEVPSLKTSYDKTSPFGLTIDHGGNIFVSDYGAHQIKKISPSGAITVVAGTGITGGVDGAGSAARFHNPCGLTLDGSGNLYVADSGTSTIRKIAPDGTVTTFAGTAYAHGNTDGLGAAARFYRPLGLAIDASGNLFVSDGQNSNIRKISPAGSVTTIAGTGIAGTKDGPGGVAQFDGPQGIALDNAGNIFVADKANQTIRKISGTGVVTTVAGTADQEGFTDGVGAAARFEYPGDLVVDATGTVFVADTGNNVIRAISPGGEVSTIAGAVGFFGTADGLGGAARFYLPQGITLDDSGHLLVADTGNGLLRRGTIVTPPRDYAGTYFGTFASGGHWALHVRADNTATYLAYLPSRASAIVVDLTVNPDGTFTVASTEIKPFTSATVRSLALTSPESPVIRTAAAASSFTLTGQIGAGGAVTGQVNGLDETFTGAADAATGPAQASAGYYTASALGTATGATYAIVSPTGQALVITTGATVDSATGTVNASGQLSATTAANAALTLTIDAAQEKVAALVTPAGSATPISYSGLSDTVTPVSRVINLSVRSNAGTGDQTLIMGFVIVGSGNKTLLARGIGPGIAAVVPTALTDPRLRLLNRDGAELEANNDWDASLTSTFSSLGASALEAASKDAAIYRALAGGVYSVHVLSNTSSNGVALAELYDGDASPMPAQVVNISARTQVGTGSDVLIAGFVITGNAPKTLLIRGLGPSLTLGGVTAVLADPQLALYKVSDLITTNDNWGGTAELKAAASTVGAGALIADNSKDAALLVTLEPGVYSAVVSGAGNTTGIGLVEIFLLP